MTAHDTDAILVERVRHGDRHAFDLLVIKYQRRIMRLLARMVHNQAEVEDIAQETFVKAWRALPQFRGDSAFYTWLYRIALNTARNWLAARQRQPLALAESENNENETLAPTQRLTEQATPETLLASKQVAQTIDAAIQALPEEQRDAIVLREIEGMSYEEIAQVMQCPVGTVRSRIYRAREAIAAQLKPVLDSSNVNRW